MTRTEDVAIATQLGVDAVGFVLVPKSPRFIEMAKAAELRRRLPPFVAAVALFQDADAPFVHDAIVQLKPDLLQFHGAEPEDFCTSFRLPFMKAISMHERQDLPRLAQEFVSAAALLLDSHVGGDLGGTGRSFDWSAIAAVNKPIVLAGGLRPDNVAVAIRSARPFAVDVSSGIETRPGVKDSAKMRAFVEAVASADRMSA